MPIEDVLTKSELHLLEQRQLQEARQARRSGNRQGNRQRRGEGLRIRLDPIPGLTKGDALKVLPYFFQCPPLESLAIARQRNHGSWQNYKGDEFLTRGGMALQGFTFRTIAVEWGTYVLEYHFDVQGLVNDLERLVVAGYPFKLTASHKYNDRPELRRTMVLESAVATENAGEPDARYIDLSFRQSRIPTSERRAKQRRGSRLNLPMTVEVKANGDIMIPGKGLLEDATLADVAKKVYGKPSWARHIMEAQKPRWVWAAHMRIIESPRYKKSKGGKLIIPLPPASETYASAKLDDSYLTQLLDD
jgi:hypothetical protein